MDTVASMNFHKSTRDCKELSEFTLLLFSEFTLLLFSKYVCYGLGCVGGKSGRLLAVA